VSGDVCVLDVHDLVHVLPLDPLRGHRAAFTHNNTSAHYPTSAASPMVAPGRDRGAAAEGLELRLDDVAVLVDLDLWATRAVTRRGLQHTTGHVGLTCSFMTSPQAGAPTRPVPTSRAFLSREPVSRARGSERLVIEGGGGWGGGRGWWG
jgi:hypothetical protein